MKKNNELQIIRAIAVTMTMVEHLPLMHLSIFERSRHYVGFWVGVDLFFVVSGFVITQSLYPMLDAIERKDSYSNHLKVFWIKRAFRIMPAAWLWLLIAYLFSLVIPGSKLFPEPTLLLKDISAAFFYYANFHWPHCWVTNTIGIDCGIPAVVGYFWSLSLEEQFYLVYPLFLIFCPKRFRMVAVAVLILYLFTMMRGALGWGWHNRIDGFAWGILIALSYRVVKPYHINSMSALMALRFLVPVLLLFMLWVSEGGVLWYMSIFNKLPFFTLGLIAFICAIIIFLATLNQRIIWLPSIFEKFAVNIGERSYSLYLAHSPSYALVKSVAIYFGFTSGWVAISSTIIIGVLLCFILAECSYRFVETPFRVFGLTQAKRIKLNAVAVQKYSA